MHRRVRWHPRPLYVRVLNLIFNDVSVLMECNVSQVVALGLFLVCLYFLHVDQSQRKGAKIDAQKPAKAKEENPADDEEEKPSDALRQ
jgi:hypothetical protein